MKKVVAFAGVAEALSDAQVDVRLFGKPEASMRRRMGVALAIDSNVSQARLRAKAVAAKIKPIVV